MNVAVFLGVFIALNNSSSPRIVGTRTVLAARNAVLLYGLRLAPRTEMSSLFEREGIKKTTTAASGGRKLRRPCDKLPGARFQGVCRLEETEHGELGKWEPPGVCSPPVGRITHTARELDPSFHLAAPRASRTPLRYRASWSRCQRTQLGDLHLASDGRRP